MSRLDTRTSGQWTTYPLEEGQWIELPVHTIWCKNPVASPDFIELLFNETDSSNFLFRRDTSITLPLEKMILFPASGIPILAPEIVLLYKSARTEDPSALANFSHVLPELSSESRHWLADALKKLYRDHVWLKDLLK